MPVAKTALAAIILTTSPTPMGQTPGHLSRAIGQHATKQRHHWGQSLLYIRAWQPRQGYRTKINSIKGRPCQTLFQNPQYNHVALLWSELERLGSTKGNG